MKAAPEVEMSITRRSLSESVYQALLRLILSGDLRGGTELNEVALATRLKVSRTPVHEALRLLAGDGLVEQGANRRTRIRLFSRQDVREIYDMRTLLEGAAVERAAGNLSKEMLAELRQEIDEILDTRAGAKWTAKAIESNRRFHETIAAACGNDRLRHDLARCRRLVQALRDITGTTENLQQALREHLEILDALEAGDRHWARRTMEIHIAKRLEAVLERVAPDKS